MPVDTKELCETGEKFHEFCTRINFTLTSNIILDAATEIDTLRDRVAELESQLAEARDASKRIESILGHSMSCFNLGCPICKALRGKYAAIEAAKGNRE